MIRFLITMTVTVALAGCEQPPRIATYSLGSEVELRIELVPTHPILAEYERVAVLSGPGKLARQPMFPDTGGYSTTNLYRCSAEQLMLSGYHDSWLVVPGKGIFYEGRCVNESYLGVFEESGPDDWQFYSVGQRPERVLKAVGE